jgi:hypothetical protein
VLPHPRTKPATTKISGSKSHPQHNQDLSTVRFIDLLGCWRDLPPAMLRDRSYPFNLRLTKSIGDKWLPTPLPKLAIGLNSRICDCQKYLMAITDAASGAKLDN